MPGTASLASQLARAWALCSGSDDARASCGPRSRSTRKSASGWRSSTPQDRQARGEPIPEEIERLLGRLDRHVDRDRRDRRHLRRRGDAEADA